VGDYMCAHGRSRWYAGPHARDDACQAKLFAVGGRAVESCDAWWANRAWPRLEQPGEGIGVGTHGGAAMPRRRGRRTPPRSMVFALATKLQQRVVAIRGVPQGWCSRGRQWRAALSPRRRSRRRWGESRAARSRLHVPLGECAVRSQLCAGGCRRCAHRLPRRQEQRPAATTVEPRRCARNKRVSLKQTNSLTACA
jgi:hypothetical protein